MKNLISIIICIAITVTGFAQEGNINISVMVPYEMQELNTGQIGKIERKLESMVTNYGVAGDSYFMIYPAYDIYNETLVEGMQNLHVLDVEFSVTIQETQTGKIYGSLTQSIQAEGTSKSQAIDKSISKIATTGDKVETFLRDTKDKILAYYTSNCDQINNEATTLIGQKRYREAIAVLYAVPKDTGSGCYDKIQKNLNKAYLGYMDATCEENIVQAKNAIKQNKNETALEVLSEIDPDANCYSEAKVLTAQAKGEATINEDGITVGMDVEGKTETVRTKNDEAEKKETSRTASIKSVAKIEYRTRHEATLAELQE
ncbi:MAG TPA: hypothetical protein VK941_11490 [Gillisia sp.]|nr:hypothetical protein [Gillisia sp.]